MARTEGFLPTVPETYRGIEVCDHVANRWLSYEGSMWRMGIDQALEAVTKTVEQEVKDIESTYSFFCDEWEEGLQEGKERAAENIEDAMAKYKKENV